VGRPAVARAAEHKNGLLAQLSESDVALLLAGADAIVIPEGRVFARAGQVASSVFFPECGLIAGFAEMTTGQHVGLGTVGPDGFLGVGTVLDLPRYAYWSIVLVETAGYRIPVAHFTEVFEESASVRKVVLAYAGWLLSEYARLAACHRLHTQRQRLARWLLVATDRARQSTLSVTHDVLAQMVGGPRHSITVALQELRAHGAINHARARVDVLDRGALIGLACECYLKGAAAGPHGSKV
jgi:CRP-like cAMP-binding protein